MPDLIDIIDDYFPANGDVGVPLQTTVSILFSEEMDETSLAEDFFVEGPDSDSYQGPGLLDKIHPDNISQGELNDFLQSPGYAGIVEGDFSFLKIDPTDANLEVSGSPYRTKLVFTPSKPLAALYDYKAIITDTLTTSGVTYSGHLVFEFQTGSGSIEEIPSAVSSSVLFPASQAASVDTTVDLSVSSTVPADLAVEQSVDSDEILIYFNKTLNASTVTSDTVTVTTEEATDHPNLTIPVSGVLDATLIVDDNLLTISDLASGIYANNIVLVELASGIEASDGTNLDGAYDFEFLTSISPAYTSVRKIRLEIGGYIRNLTDYTIQFANLEASIEADVLNFTDSTDGDMFRHARRQYTTCLAAAMLAGNLGNRSLKTKTLGDLHVEYDTQGINDLNRKLDACLARWEPQLLGGGTARANAAPQMVIKGDLDPDRPIASRSWHSTQEGVSRRIPAANERVRYNTQRRYLRSFRKKLS